MKFITTDLEDGANLIGYYNTCLCTGIFRIHLKSCCRFKIKIK